MKTGILTSAVLSVLMAGCVSTETASITPPADVTPPAGDPAPNPDPAPDPDPAPTDPAPVTVATRARYMEFGQGEDSRFVVMDRTETAVDVDLTAHPDGKLDVQPRGTMTGGAALPAETGMSLVSSTANSATYEGTDAFLTQVGISPDMGIGIFRAKPRPNAGLVGYSIDGNRTQNMPTSGIATFNGAATLTVVRDYVVESAVGETSLTATFGDGATISGLVSNITTGLRDDTAPFAEPLRPRQLGADIVLHRTPIVGNTYEGGNLHLVYAGEPDALSGSVDHAEYSGAFFGPGAAGTGGTLHFKGTNMGATLGNVEITGGFYGNR